MKMTKEQEEAFEWYKKGFEYGINTMIKLFKEILEKEETE